VDACDVSGGTSNDCNGNVTPDECEAGGTTDCNLNQSPDLCDIHAGVSSDCNLNAAPDACDVSSGASTDCDANGVPDECDPDCNENGVADACDVQSGGSPDTNGDGIPDECWQGWSVIPIGATGPHSINGSEVSIFGGPQQITFEIRLSGWGSLGPDNPRMKRYQVLLGMDGFTTGESGSISLSTTVPCQADYDCFAYSVCEATGYCDKFGSFYIDVTRPNFPFYGVPTVSFWHPNPPSPEAFAIAFYDADAAIDNGNSYYAATLIMDVPADAYGEFTIDSWWALGGQVVIEPPHPEAIEFLPWLPGRVIVSDDCNDNLIADYSEIAADWTLDCDSNRVLDSCEGRVGACCTRIGGPWSLQYECNPTTACGCSGTYFGDGSKCSTVSCSTGALR
jgi:hypothetical protein